MESDELRVKFFNFGSQTFSQSLFSKNRPRRAARRLGGWQGLQGGLGHFSGPNKEDEAAETEENKSKLGLTEKRNGFCKLCHRLLQPSCSFRIYLKGMAARLYS
ncbi:unnamed protein product [Prunus armeniaca]